MLELGNVVNPNNKPVEELPKIIGFIRPTSIDSDVIGQLVAEDGEGLGSHWSSSEGWAKLDLGVEGNQRPDRHKTFAEHYPDGYAMYWAGDRKEPELLAAIAKNHEKAKRNGQSKGDNVSNG